MRDTCIQLGLLSWWDGFLELLVAASFSPQGKELLRMKSIQKKTQPRERKFETDKVSDLMMLYKALDPDSSLNLSQKKNLF